MATLSSIITPSNLVTASSTDTLTNKTIDGDNNTVTNISRFFSVTVEGSGGSSDWTQATGSDPWIATMTVSGILSADRPTVDLDLSGVAFADVEAVQTDWALVYRVEASANNEIKFYATNEPTETFPVQIEVVR